MRQRTAVIQSSLKGCISCGQDKLRSEFSMDRRMPEGTCKQCARRDRREEKQRRERREKAAPEAGFARGLLGEKFSLQGLSAKAKRAFSTGEKHGIALREQLGSDRASRLARQAGKLQSETADIHHLMLVRGVDDSELEPCGTCRWIGVCKATGRTCRSFRIR